MKSSEEVREALEEKSDEELQDLIEGLEEKISAEPSPGPISTTMLLRCRKKAIASSILEDRGSRSVPEGASAPTKSEGQKSLGGFA